VLPDGDAIARGRLESALTRDGMELRGHERARRAMFASAARKLSAASRGTSCSSIVLVLDSRFHLHKSRRPDNV
jgi:hypothetical protein